MTKVAASIMKLLMDEGHPKKIEGRKIQPRKNLLLCAQC